MATRLEIQNAALLELGQPAIINANENTHVNQLMIRIYDLLVEQVQIQGNWSCLERRATLTRLEGVADVEYQYAFSLPETPGVLRVIEFRGQDGFIGADWQLSGNMILTNSPEAHIVYSGKLVDEADWDSHLTMTVVAGIKYRVAKALQESATITDGFRNEFLGLLNQNRSNDNQQSSVQPLESSTLVAIRQAYSGDLLRVGRTGGSTF